MLRVAACRPAPGGAAQWRALRGLGGGVWAVAVARGCGTRKSAAAEAVSVRLAARAGGLLAPKGRPGIAGAGLWGARVGRGGAGPHLPALPVSLSRGVEWKSYGWVRRDQADLDEAPHALLEGISSDPRQNGKQGPLAGWAGLAAGKQRLAGLGAAWSLQGGWARASDSSEALSHGATSLWPVAGQPGDS